MANLDQRARANMGVALEEACRVLPHGGDHNLRKKIALKLLLSARKGNTTLSGLSVVARTALMEATRQKQKKSAKLTHYPAAEHRPEAECSCKRL